MKDHSGCQQMDSARTSIATELELSDFDADQRLLSLPGISLVIFTSPGCAACRYARERLPLFSMPVDRLAWIDAGDNNGLVQRYDVFHLPAMFLVRDGGFQGPLHSRLAAVELHHTIDEALGREPQELP
ncbi:hypothetical protein M2262_002946 [Pseudomonas sp. BIGb0408]|uniref:Thioredoxin n=1 Tax=Phytopseudomonas flavescens TaxID=29435 RepID=A0A7Y9XM56_9GAMM|nr:MULTISPECIES: thioredoxin family protein [Pseudomonas]MCW2292896.1 hypothetical protein [Pseudomonas sp. BIGb0408]NYH72534.1 hypothetical protein [Pseudomonas flavescens]